MSLRSPKLGPLAVLVALVVMLVVAAGCSSGPATPAAMPDASALLNNSGAAMRSVTSVRFALDIKGTLPGVPLREADGDLNAQGQAKGTAKLTELGQLVQVDFVVFNKTFYLKGPTGGYTKIPSSLAGNLFDPGLILNPDTGVAKIVTSVQGAHTEGRETVNGIDCYKISGKVGKDEVSALVPGVNSDVNTTLWVAADNKNLPVKAEFSVPGTDGSQGATVDVTISNINVPVSINAPA